MKLKNLSAYFTGGLSRKLALPVLAVVLVFALPGYMVYLSDRVTDQTNESVIFRSDGLIHLTEMEAALSTEHMAAYEFMFEGLPSARDDFFRQSAVVEQKHAEAMERADTGTQRANLEECLVLHRQAVDLFQDQIVPLKLANADMGQIMPLELQLHNYYKRIEALRSTVADLFYSDQRQALFDQVVSRERVSEYIWASAITAVILGLIIAGFTARRIVRPVKRIAAAARQVAGGDLGSRVKFSGSDELADLSGSFNLMADSLQRRTLQLEQEQARIRSIHQSIGDGLVVVDNGGVIVSVNPAGERILGKAAVELEGATNTGVPDLQKRLRQKILSGEMARCWEAKECHKEECPSHGSHDLRCWLQCGTFCYNQIQGTFKQKRDACERCDVFRMNAVQEFTLAIGDRRYSTAIIPILDDEGQEEGRTVAMHDITSMLHTQETLERHTAELEVINSISETLSSSLDLDTTLDNALQKVIELTPGGAAAIHLVDESGDYMDLVAEHGYPDSVKQAVSRIPIEAGIAGPAFKEGNTILVNDVSQDKRVLDAVRQAGFHSLMAVPLHYKDRGIGVMMLPSTELNAYTEDDASLMMLVGRQVAVAIENSRLYEASLRHAREIAAKNRIVNTLASSLRVDDVFDDFAEETRKLVDCDRISVTVVEDDGCSLRAIYPGGSGPLLLDDSGRTRLFANTSVAWVMEHKRPFISGDLSAEEEELLDHAKLKEMGMRSLLNLPLFARDRLLGTINMASARAGAYDERTVEKLQPVTAQLALAIANQKLLEDVTRSKTEWETTFDAVSEGIAIVNRQHQVVRLNQAAANMVGGDLEELVGQKCYQVIHKLARQPLGCPMTDAVLGAGTTRTEQAFPDGRTMELVIDPMFDAGGNAIGAVHFLRDITEAKKLRQQLLQSEKMVAVGQLVAGVAHEINNPLTGVTGYSQLLLSRDIDERTRRDVEQINHEAERASKIVRHLLSFARKHQPERRLLDINQVIRESLELKAYDLRVNNITTELFLGEDLPPTTVDPHQLQQVFLNLITNAEHAMLDGAGGGRLGISTEVHNGLIRVAFADTGPGIPADLSDRIFDPFFTTKDVGKGTGLGLSVCFGIVEEHGGKIWADTTFTGGARLVVDLPIVTEQVFGDTSSDRPIDLQQRVGRILLVDDEAAIREVMRETLKRTGHTVDTAINGQVALRMVRQKQYDCIVTDVKMPGIDGPTLHQAVSETDPELAGTFIFISGDTVSPETRSYLSRTECPYLAKPFKLEDLELLLQDVLTGKKD